MTTDRNGQGEAGGRPEIADSVYRPHPDLRFVTHEGAQYGYLPVTMTYFALNSDMERVLEAFDGRRTVEGVLAEHNLPAAFQDVIHQLLDRGILVADTEGARRRTVSLEADGRAHITIFPTSDCNLRCRYCYASAGDRPRTMNERTLEHALACFWSQFPEQALFGGR